MPSDLLMEKRKHAQRKGDGSSKLEGTLGIYPWWSLLMGHLEHVSCLKISSSFQILFGRELLVACLILHKFKLVASRCVTSLPRFFLFISMTLCLLRHACQILSACHFAAYYTQRSLLQVGFLQDLCVFALEIPFQQWEPRHKKKIYRSNTVHQYETMVENGWMFNKGRDWGIGELFELHWKWHELCRHFFDSTRKLYVCLRLNCHIWMWM